MEPALEQVDVAAAARFWRRAFLFASVGGLVVALPFHTWWPWILSAGKEGARPEWGLGRAGLCLWAGVAAFPLLALAGLWLQRRLSSRQRGVVILVAVGACVLTAEAAIRTRSIQSNFWVAVLSRLDPSDWGMREPAMLHYENLNAAKLYDEPLAAPGIARIPEGMAIFGSSQGAVNFDRDLMSRALGHPVIRRSLNGMFAFEMCAARQLLVVPRVQTAIFYLSPLDLAANVNVRADWMRSVITPQTWLDLVAVLKPRLALENARPLSELALAARLRLWAFRDGARWLLFHLAGRPSDPPSRQAGAAPSAPPVKPLVIKPEYVEASFRGYEHLFAQLRELDYDIVVFQGEINPILRRQIDDAYWMPMEGRMRAFFETNGIAHVSLEHYQPRIAPDDWRDNTHLNEKGRQKLTEAVVRYLQAGRGN